MSNPISDKQLQANRRNALRSSGPRSEAGKAIVSQNAISHGLLARHVVIEGESQTKFDLFHEEMVAELKPVGMLECSLLDKIASSIWRQHRAVRIENEVMGTLRDPMEGNTGNKNQVPFKFVINKHYAGLPEGHEEDKDSAVGLPNSDVKENSDVRNQRSDKKPERLSLGRAVRNDIEGANILQKFQRYASEIDRALYKAIREFDRLQEKRVKRSIIDVEASAEG